MTVGIQTGIKADSNVTWQALSLISKLFYFKFGEEAIPIIRQVWYELGLAAGTRLKTRLKLKEHSFMAAANALKTEAKETETLRDLTENSYHIRTKKGTPCAAGLDNTARPLCEAVMTVNEGEFKAICSKDIVMDITKSRAAGDDYCEIFYYLKTAQE